MSARKLQVEIDRTMKKINEGIIEFEALMSKVRTASTTNQKDKLEADLKRDIKKLQRLREQVKGWISGTEVKDKAPLQDARKRIETQMEAFKAYEREAKTKAFSKEGLQRQREKEMKGEEGRDISEWLQDRIEELKRQIEVLEGEIELEAGKKPKKSGSGVEASAARLERHNFHLDGLEKLLRMWENEAIDREKVEGVKDDIDYYVDNNLDDDFMENETIYDDLGLDEWDPAEGLDHEYEAYEPEDDDSTAEDQLSADGSTNAEDDLETSSSSSSNLAAPSSALSSLTSSSTASITQGETSSKSSATSNKSAAQPASTASDKLPTDATATKKTSDAAPGNRTASNPTTAATNGSSALPAVSLDPTPAEAARGIRASASLLPTENAPTHVTPSHMTSVGVLPSAPSAGSLPPSGTTNSVATNASTVSAQGSGTLPNAQAPNPASLTSTPLSTTGQLPLAGLTNSGLMVGMNTANAGIPNLASTASNLSGSTSSELPMGANVTGLSVPTGGVVMNAAVGGATLMGTGPNATMAAQNVASISPATVGVPRVGPPIRASESEMMEMAGLKASARYIPEPEPTRPPYKPRTPTSTPSSYPSTPAQNLLDDPATFQKFPPDLLFFLFYFQQNTYQQYLAARELKRQSWRYHTKYLTWFQRHEDPKTINESYEQGTYVYFDYETGWCQRKKSEFTFQYVFLEDNELP